MLTTWQLAQLFSVAPDGIVCGPGLGDALLSLHVEAKPALVDSIAGPGLVHSLYAFDEQVLDDTCSLKA